MQKILCSYVWKFEHCFYEKAVETAKKNACKLFNKNDLCIYKLFFQFRFLRSVSLCTIYVLYKVLQKLTLTLYTLLRNLLAIE